MTDSDANVAVLDAVEVVEDTVTANPGPVADSASVDTMPDLPPYTMFETIPVVDDAHPVVNMNNPLISHDDPFFKESTEVDVRRDNRKTMSLHKPFLHLDNEGNQNKMNVGEAMRIRGGQEQCMRLGESATIITHGMGK